MSENKEKTENLTPLEVQVDRDEQVHSFTDNGERWIFRNPIALVDLVQTYTKLVEETGEDLTPLEIQVDPDGQVHSFTDANKTWIFIHPISVVDLVQKYKEILANVTMELKGLPEASPKSSPDLSWRR